MHLKRNFPGTKFVFLVRTCHSHCTISVAYTHTQIVINNFMWFFICELWRQGLCVRMCVCVLVNHIGNSIEPWTIYTTFFTIDIHSLAFTIPVAFYYFILASHDASRTHFISDIGYNWLDMTAKANIYIHHRHVCAQFFFFFFISHHSLISFIIGLKLYIIIVQYVFTH